MIKFYVGVIICGLLLTILAISLEPDPEICNEFTIPKYEFVTGEKAIFNKTGETVRVIGIWSNLICGKTANYGIRFNDAAEIGYIHWSSLLPLKGE